MTTESSQAMPAQGLGPGHSRLWIFPLAASLAPDARAALTAELQEFVDSWRAHKAPVSGKVMVLFEKFVLVAADEELVRVSGCSNDQLFRTVQTAAERAGSRVCDPENVHYRSAAGAPCTVSRRAFKLLAEQGEIGLETPVFDPTITTVADLQNGKFEKPVRESWHAKLLPV